jgi:hypothetical protein
LNRGPPGILGQILTTCANPWYHGHFYTSYKAQAI